MDVSAAWVDTWRSAAATSCLPGGHDPATDSERVSLLRSLEDLKSTAAALQAELAVALDRSQRAQQAAAGEPAERQGRGVAAQIALARRESPHRGAVLLGLAKALDAELPHTATALRAGRLSEFRAQLIAQETTCLEVEDRREVDEAICGDAGTIEGLGTRRLVGLVRHETLTRDPAAVVRRARRAESERHVSVRPAPDTMAYLTALLPVAEAVACFAALTAAAKTSQVGGEQRSKSQLMADTLVERITGQSHAVDVPVGVEIVISDASLFGAGTEPADMPGHGPIPAEIARHLIAHSLDADTMTWIRRLYADPAGDLVAMTSRQRFMSDALKSFLSLRDQGLCRTPWCDAPIRDGDHVTPSADGGETSSHNGQGLCQACNHAKQAPGWRQRARTAGRHQVTTTTPTGHRYTSTASPPPSPSRSRPSALDRALDRIRALTCA